ncbi:MAG: nucleoside hydrolase [Lachnospiraceae bacterium]
MDDRIPIIMDCDPGHDDAIALLMALASEKINVLGVTTTAGNQTLAKTTANARKILSFVGSHVPLAKGNEKPMARELEIAPAVHGASGMDGPVFPPNDYPVSSEPAWDFSRRLILASPVPVTLVATGPQTNLGILLSKYPEVKKNIREIAFLGGGIDHGNWTAAAEFNILVDPEAVKIVLESGLPIRMVGLDVTEKALMKHADIEELRNDGRPVPVLVAQLLDFFLKFHEEIGFAGAPMHDPCVIAYLIDPSIFKMVPYYLQVETRGNITTGMILADKRLNNKKPSPNAKVAMEIDRDRFIALLKSLMKSY